MKMERRVTRIMVRIEESNGVFVASTDRNLGPVAWGDSRKEAEMKMEDALKVYGATVSLINAINLYETNSMGKDTMERAVVNFEYVLAA